MADDWRILHLKFIRTVEFLKVRGTSVHTLPNGEVLDRGEHLGQGLGRERLRAHRDRRERGPDGAHGLRRLHVRLLRFRLLRASSIVRAPPRALFFARASREADCRAYNASQTRLELLTLQAVEGMAEASWRSR